MSDLRPKGVEVRFGGLKHPRTLLFTLNVINEIQEKYECTVLEIIEKILHGNVLENAKLIREVTCILLEDERKRKKWEDPDCDLEELTEEQVGWIIEGQSDIQNVAGLIVTAYLESVPKPDGNDPNRPSPRKSTLLSSFTGALNAVIGKLRSLR